MRFAFLVMPGYGLLICYFCLFAGRMWVVSRCLHLFDAMRLYADSSPAFPVRKHRPHPLGLTVSKRLRQRLLGSSGCPLRYTLRSQRLRSHSIT